MSRNTEKIGAGLRSLMSRPNEIASGKVTGVDDANGTVTVQLADNSEPLKAVKLQAVTGAGDGCLLVPKNGSHVVIGSVDGPGEWVVLGYSEIEQAKLKIGDIECEVSASLATIKNGNVVLELGASAFTVKTASENLFDLLKDLITEITLLTVGTPAGPSSPPTNVANFTNLLTRLANILAH